MLREPLPPPKRSYRRRDALRWFIRGGWGREEILIGLLGPLAAALVGVALAALIAWAYNATGAP